MNIHFKSYIYTYIFEIIYTIINDRWRLHSWKFLKKATEMLTVRIVVP